MDQQVELAAQMISLDTGLSSVQRAAIDLYRRGLNVFPVCRPEEVQMLASQYPKRFEQGSKLPYILEPLFFSRMHLCDEDCHERDSRLGRLCAGARSGIHFVELFDFANLAVILGRTSKNLVCVDCDIMPLFEQVLQEFTRRNLPYWAYHTSRGGNILFRLKEGEAANMGKCNFPGVQIWGNKHFCVLPPSVHASGVIYTWLMYTDPAINLPPLEPPPLLSLDQVDWLGVRPAYNERKEINLYGLPEWTCHISENNRKILASEIPDGERNLQLTKAVYDVAACVDDGIVDFSDAEKLLLASAERCIPPYSPKKIKGMLHSAMRKDGLKPAREYYPDVNLSSQRDDLPNKAKHFLENYDWHIFGRTAQTDRAVFTACVKRAELDRSEIFRASTREIADLANIQEPYTALKSLRRLQEKNIILRVDRQSSGAFQYKFGPEVTVPDHYTIPHLKNNVVMEHTPKTGECLPTTSVEQDIFLSLGRVSWFVWQHLKHSPERGATDIAKKRNLVRSSVSKSLNRLVKIGLVTYSTAEGIYFGEFFNTDALEELAERMGVLGKSDKRAQRFNRDREIRVNLQISKARSNFRNMRQTFQSGAKKEA